MRRLFKKGDRVRSKLDGNIVEVLKYVKGNVIEVKSFDANRREVYFNQLSESNLQRQR